MAGWPTRQWTRSATGRSPPKMPVGVTISRPPPLDGTFGDCRGDKASGYRQLEQSEDAQPSGRAHEHDRQHQREPGVLKEVAATATKVPLASAAL